MGLRILWVSNAAWASTGYGNQTALFASRLKHQLGHEVACVAFYGLQGGVLTWDDIKVYPQMRNGYGDDAIVPHAVHFKPDIVITLTDIWVFNLELFNKQVRWCPWFPADHDPLPIPIAERAQHAYRPIVFSRFGERMMHDAGMECDYVPHGVDTKVYAPVDQAEARRALGLPADMFIAGMVGANKGQPARKSFAEVIAAWAKFKQKRPDSLLYVHTIVDQTYGGMPFAPLLQHHGLEMGRDVVFSDQYMTFMGFPATYMQQMYSALDVLVHPSAGEGFGICQVEAQACGVPIIVGDWTSMSELCWAGWKIEKEKSHPFWTPLASYQWLPDPAEITRCLQMAYNAKGDVKLRQKAREGALAYDANLVADTYWKPTLDRLEARIRSETTPAEIVEVTA